MDIGFIGVGTMGSRIAENLVNTGFTVRVWNREPEPVDALSHTWLLPSSVGRSSPPLGSSPSS